MQPRLTTETHRDDSRTRTSYRREDLGILTATIEREPESPWVINLCYGPDPHEHDSYQRALESDADQLAREHSLSW
jgi:hypothetical protein